MCSIVPLTIISLGLLKLGFTQDVDQTPATGWGGTRCYDKFRNAQVKNDSNQTNLYH